MGRIARSGPAAMPWSSPSDALSPEDGSAGNRFPSGPASSVANAQSSRKMACRSRTPTPSIPPALSRPPPGPPRPQGPRAPAPRPRPGCERVDDPLPDDVHIQDEELGVDVVASPFDQLEDRIERGLSPLDDGSPVPRHRRERPPRARGGGGPPLEEDRGDKDGGEDVPRRGEDQRGNPPAVMHRGRLPGHDYQRRRVSAIIPPLRAEGDRSGRNGVDSKSTWRRAPARGGASPHPP